jgi:hypothetical protein
VLVLLMSRPLIIMSVILAKLTRSSCIPQQASANPEAAACTGRHWQGCCQAAVNKPYLVFFGSMHVLVHESPAGKLAVPSKTAIQSGTPKYVLRNRQYVHVCTHKKCEKRHFKFSEKIIYLYVLRVTAWIFPGPPGRVLGRGWQDISRKE